MARPMILIKQELLDELYEKNKTGVPVLRLIKDHKLNVTHPTLGKLMRYMDTLNAPKISADNYRIVAQSLFPEWLQSQHLNVKKQPPTWRYEGKFPLGQWVENQWSDDNAKDQTTR